MANGEQEYERACEFVPRSPWTDEFSRSALDESLVQYLSKGPLSRRSIDLHRETPRVGLLVDDVWNFFAMDRMRLRIVDVDHSSLSPGTPEPGRERDIGEDRSRKSWERSGQILHQPVPGIHDLFMDDVFDVLEIDDLSNGVLHLGDSEGHQEQGGKDPQPQDLGFSVSFPFRFRFVLWRWSLLYRIQALPRTMTTIRSSLLLSDLSLLVRWS